jgi:IPT/TIG domain
MRKIESIGVCALVALALSMVSASSALARRPSSGVFVLKANGQVVPNGAHVDAEAATYFFKTHVKPEGFTSSEEEEVECENELFEQGTIQRDFATKAWQVVEMGSVDLCEGEWFEGNTMTHALTLSAPNVVTDYSTVELFRTEEQIEEEETSEFEHGEPIHARGPTRCMYTTTSDKGTFKKREGVPLVAKVKGKLALSPSATSTGCAVKAKWKGSFTLTYLGRPISVALEPEPTVSSVIPMEGPEDGRLVSISGTHFTGATAVQFGSTNATSFTVNSDGSISASAPPGSGTVNVTVTTPVSTTAITMADQFTYQPQPTVTGVSPNAGDESGGTEVSITGTNFTSGSTVRFGSTAASSVKVNSTGSITAVSPAGSGSVQVTVTTAGGTSTTSPADEFTY